MGYLGLVHIRNEEIRRLLNNPTRARVVVACDDSGRRTREEQRLPQNYELGATGCQTKEHVETSDHVGHMEIEVIVNMAHDRTEWRRRTRLTPCR